MDSRTLTQTDPARAFRTVLLAGALSLLSATAFAQAGGETLFVHAGKLLADPSTGKVLTQQTLVIKGGKVSAIQPGFVGDSSQGRVLDLKDRFVLPGLIDSHVHLTSEQAPTQRLDSYLKTRSDVTLDGAAFAKKTLMAGFTTVADLGANNESVFALRAATAQGKVPGPRILASGSSVTPHGGHGDANGVKAEFLDEMRSPSVCSGDDDCTRAVREQIRAGADVIKITATGGVLSNTKAGLGQQFSDDELEAIMETAHAMGRKVTAHAHGVDGINAALKAGVDSIEHGTYLNAESIALFKAKGAYLVPTLMAGDYVAREAAKPDTFFTPAQKSKALEAGPKMLDMATRAIKGGVKIAFGTDSGVSKHGQNAYEFELLVKAGMTPLQAVQSATIHAADHLDIASEAGKLLPGFGADLIAVEGDPTQDVRTLQAVKTVVRAGVVYKD